MATSTFRVPADSTGKKVRTRTRTVNGQTIHEPYYIEQDERVISYKGRVNTFRIPGRAATQYLASIWNNTGSSVIVDVRRIVVDLVTTVAKTITQEAPLVRVVKHTAINTGGTAGTKVALDTALSSSASVTVWQDASADRTLSAVAMALTPTGTITQEYASRVFTGAGQEASDSIAFMGYANTDMSLAATQGLAVVADLGSAGLNPSTDIWTVFIEWLEYTLP